jgi:hypothetical protein
MVLGVATYAAWRTADAWGRLASNLEDLRDHLAGPDQER